MRTAGLAYLVAFATAAATPAMAWGAAPVELTCPVGGEGFSFTPTASSLKFGERPDGKPLGPALLSPELPVCPGNQLVMFQSDFSADDKAALEKLIVDPGYRALPAGASYYRAAWLMRRLNRDPQEIAAMILQASWQADADPAAKRRYQAEYATLIEPLVSGKDDDLSMALAGRAANARRELGQFEAAGALLDALPLASLTILIPVEQRDGDVVTNQAEIDGARQKRALFSYLAGIKDLVAGRNAQSEPVAMLSAEIAAERCRDGATLSDDDRAACAARPAAGTPPTQPSP